MPLSFATSAWYRLHGRSRLIPCQRSCWRRVPPARSGPRAAGLRLSRVTSSSGHRGASPGQQPTSMAFRRSLMPLRSDGARFRAMIRAATAARAAESSARHPNQAGELHSKAEHAELSSQLIRWRVRRGVEVRVRDELRAATRACPFAALAVRMEPLRVGCCGGRAACRVRAHPPQARSFGLPRSGIPTRKPLKAGAAALRAGAVDEPGEDVRICSSLEPSRSTPLLPCISHNAGDDATKGDGQGRHQ